MVGPQERTRRKGIGSQVPGNFPGGVAWASGLWVRGTWGGGRSACCDPFHNVTARGRTGNTVTGKDSESQEEL